MSDASPPPGGTPATGPRIGRLHRRADFDRLRREARRGSAGPITVKFVQDNDVVPPRFAFAVPRKVGTAVIRNRVRRQMKAALPALSPAPGLYLVLVRPGADAGPVPHLRRALERVAV